MSGNREGGRKAAATNIKNFGPNFYKEIGRKGGSRLTPNGGFGSKKVGPDGLTGVERARIAGSKGGRLSTRKGIKNGEGRKANRDIEEAERILEEESGRD